MRYFPLTIEMYGNEGYRLKQIKKKKLKFLEHFLEIHARDILEMEKSAETNWNNFFPGFKFLQ